MFARRYLERARARAAYNAGLPFAPLVVPRVRCARMRVVYNARGSPVKPPPLTCARVSQKQRRGRDRAGLPKIAKSKRTYARVYYIERPQRRRPSDTKSRARTQWVFTFSIIRKKKCYTVTPVTMTVLPNLRAAKDETHDCNRSAVFKRAKSLIDAITDSKVI